MDNLKNLLNILISGKKHEHYIHVTDYAQTLEDYLVADEEATERLLVRFTRRETEEEKKLRAQVTSLLTSSVMYRVMNPFQKALRNDDIIKGAEPPEKLTEITEGFYGNESLDKYIHSRAFFTTATDPNAWILLNWNDFNADLQKAEVYPVIIPSCDVWDYEYDNNELQWLAWIQKGFRSSIVSAEEIVELRVVDKPEGLYVRGKDIVDGDVEQVDEGTIIEAGGNYYEYHLHEPKLERVQARQLGYLIDPKTKETFVSFFHPALNRMKKLIKTCSEMDITMSQHVFPQKIVARHLCNGYEDDNGKQVRCNGGVVKGKETCPTCNGSGYEPIHRSATDVIQVPLTDDKDDQFNLDNIIKYVDQDTELPKFMNDYIRQLEQDVLSDVFTSNAFSENTAQRTATEVQVNYDSIYDTLYPFTNFISGLWRWVVETAGLIRDDKFTEVKHIFPADLKLESLAELVEKYKNSEGAPMAVRKAIQEQIIEKKFKGDEIGKRKNLLMVMHEPFSDKTEAEFQFIAVNNLAPEWLIYLKTNYTDVFRTLDQKDPMWFEKSPELIREALKKTVEQDYIPNRLNEPTLE